MPYFRTREAIRRRRSEKAAPLAAYSKMFNGGRAPPLDAQDAVDRWLRERRDSAYLKFAAKRQREIFGLVGGYQGSGGDANPFARRKSR
jgi:hypothetical protein